MRKLKNSCKILSILLLGIFFISIIILPNSNFVSENIVNDNTIDTTPPQVSGPAAKDNQTFVITQSEDDAYSHNFDPIYFGPKTNYDTTNITLGIIDKDDPFNSDLSMGIALRWNITIPKLAHITKAYINLTVANLTYWGLPWTGFNTSISVFDDVSTNDFSNANEVLKNRILIGDLLWELDGTELINQTLQTVDIKDLLQQIVILGGWDGIFGAFIQPGVGTDTDLGNGIAESIQFWAYDSGNPEYYPKLYIEWDDTPFFTDTPEDQTIYENKPLGYYSLDWDVWDNDPDAFKVTCNIPVSGIPNITSWEAGEVIFDLSPLDVNIYNFTVCFNDTDGNVIWDSVIVTVVAVIPYFTDTPEDMYIFEKSAGFPVKWQVWDNNPHKFKITCNESILSKPDIKDWTSGWFTYNLPALERGFYNFTAYFNDTDGHLIWDSVIVEAGPPKPIITSGTFKIDQSGDDASYKPQKGSAFAESATILELGGSTVIDDTAQRVICLRFNTAIPKHVRIKNAYVNLTVSSISNYIGGFTSEIYLFYPPVADFTDDNDAFTLHPRWNETRPSNRNKPAGGGHLKPEPLEWTLPGSLFSNNTIQTPNFTSYLQEIIDFPNFDGYIGLYIMPTAGVGSGEKVNTYSYDGAIIAKTPQYIPTLFVEWEESPYFVSTPADITAKNGIHGYHLDWIAADDNPTTFSISCNRMVSNIPPGSTIYSGVWQSGVETFYNWIYDGWEQFNTETITTKIRYNLPPLEIGVYNFTIRINDADSLYNLDSVIVTVTDLDLPVINLEFIQKGKEVDYFQCGNGPFTVRIYNSTSITPTAWLTAYYPGYVQYIYSTALPGGTTPIPALAIIEGDTYGIEQFDDLSYFPYNPVLGCYEFTCPLSSAYTWMLYKLQCLNINQKTTFFKIISDIEYNVLNRIEIRINEDDQYIYNQTIYGGRWAHPFEVWNKDLTPPMYSEPEFIEPDDPDKHYEVNIWASSEAYGAAVESVFLYYSIDDGPWEETEMILKDGKYYAEIPAQEEGSTIDYYIKITDIAGNIIETEIYHERAPTFEEPSIIIPIVGILFGILGSLSIVAIYRHKNKAALKKLRSERSPKLSKKSTNIGNKLLQKIKKVRRKQ